MVHRLKGAGWNVTRLLAVALLFGCPRIGSAAGTWSVVATSGTDVGQVYVPHVVAVDSAGNLYITDDQGRGRIQKRDAQGNWSVIATFGADLGQVSSPFGLAVDNTGNLYVADGRIQKRDPQGNWSVIAMGGAYAVAVAVDTADNLYVSDYDRIQKRDTQGNLSLVASHGFGIGQVVWAIGLAVDAAGNLYVEEGYNSLFGSANRIQKQDTHGNWSIIAPDDSDPLQVGPPLSLAVDGESNVYTTDYYPWVYGNTFNRILKRGARGNWSVVTTSSDAPDQVLQPVSIAVDAVGNLYVADQAENRVLKYSPGVQ